jgi:hypothetical protein
MKAEDRFTAGREKKRVIEIICHSKWHEDGAALEFVGGHVAGKGSKRLTVAMKKSEALELAIALLKMVRGI